MTAKTLGFGGQWVQIFRAGNHTDIKGRTHNLDAAFVENLVSNFSPEEHEPPAVIGHPETDAPAYGYIAGLRKNGDLLEAQFADVDPQFEQMVRDGKFKKRSTSFYLDKEKSGLSKVPAVRHVGFLGAKPPAVKSLENIHFAEGEEVTIEFSEGDTPVTEKKNEKTIGEQIADFFREKFGAAKDDKTISFGEADVRALVVESVTAAVKPLNDQITSLQAKNEALQKQIDGQAGHSQRGEIVAFCEGLEKKGVLPPSFRKMGGVEFMEALASLPADRKVITIEFGDDDEEKKVEVAPIDFFKGFLEAHPPYISFGEQYGDLRAQDDARALSGDPKQREAMRREMGLSDKKDDKK